MIHSQTHTLKGWPGHRLVKIGLAARPIAKWQFQNSFLFFLGVWVKLVALRMARMHLLKINDLSPFWLCILAESEFRPMRCEPQRFLISLDMTMTLFNIIFPNYSWCAQTIFEMWDCETLNILKNDSKCVSELLCDHPGTPSFFHLQANHPKKKFSVDLGPSLSLLYALPHSAAWRSHQGLRNCTILGGSSQLASG